MEPDGGIKHNQVAREESRLEKVKIIKERNKNNFQHNQVTGVECCLTKKWKWKSTKIRLNFLLPACIIPHDPIILAWYQGFKPWHDDSDTISYLHGTKWYHIHHIIPAWYLHDTKASNHDKMIRWHHIIPAWHHGMHGSTLELGEDTRWRLQLTEPGIIFNR